MNSQFAGLTREACVALLASYPLSVGILAGQWIALHRYLQQLEALNQPLLHLDLMDGQFCPQFTVGAMGSWATAANFYQRCSFDGSGPMDGGASLREGGRTLHHASGRRRYSSASYAKLAWSADRARYWR